MSKKPDVPEQDVSEPEVPEDSNILDINDSQFVDENEIQVPEETTVFETMMEPANTIVQFDQNEDVGGGQLKGLTFRLRDNPPLSIIIVYAIQVASFSILQLKLCWELFHSKSILSVHSTNLTEQITE